MPGPPTSDSLASHIDKAADSSGEGDRYSRSAVYGSPLCMQKLGTQATLYLEDSHIVEVALMGQGTFMLRLSVVEQVSNLVAHSPITIDGKIISLVPWSRGFRATDSDTQFHIPRFPMTLLFLGRAMELRHCVSDFGAHYGWVMQDTHAKTVASVGVP